MNHPNESEPNENTIESEADMNETIADETETADPRQEATHRLSTVGMLQLHQLRRARRPGRGAPWLDPSQGQGRVLALLQLKPETTQKDLTFLLGMSRQATAELLSKLEKQGLIEREPSPDDRRVVVVRLTEAGKAAEQATERPPHGTPELLDALDDDEVAQLSGYLGRIIEHAEQEWAGQLGDRREAFEEFWRSRGGFDPRMRPGFGRGGFPGDFGGPGGPWGPGGPGGHPGHHGRRGRRGRRDDQAEE
ncbi:MarR family winged helix-turn-helix transcriptional regulator [Promicromonospora vindobonensis]|uniref:MarR family winged helix-turn-helix transcriptional regulator n=1 Tax=Promicromonospora vindobonensis TaxID=195748 RepID=A0ABW5VWT0_9MICO